MAQAKKVVRGVPTWRGRAVPSCSCTTNPLPRTVTLTLTTGGPWQFNVRNGLKPHNVPGSWAPIFLEVSHFLTVMMLAHGRQESILKLGSD